MAEYEILLPTGERIHGKLLTKAPEPSAIDPPMGPGGSTEPSPTRPDFTFNIDPEKEPEEPTEPSEETETTEETEAIETEETSETSEDQEEESSETKEELEVECDHGWYPEVTIALAGLSLALIIALVIQSIRVARRKRRRKRKTAAPQTVETITVGKLHSIGARSSQQDSLAVTPQELYGDRGMLAVVADGMGGLADGDKMSQAAATAMVTGYMGSREPGVDILLPLTEMANQSVNQVLGIQNRGRSGTTLVAGIAKDGLFSYVSVGDSRICLYRGGMLSQLNREHIYRNELAVQAVNSQGTFWDAASHPKAAGLTSYLGMGELKYVDIPAEYIRLRSGDKIILMSDGVYNALSLEEMEQAMALPAQQAADQMGQLIQAKAYRNQDNYTAVILECG